MPIGVGAALLIGSAASAGTALAGAKMQSNAAKKAQQAQQAGTDKALQIQHQVNAPYMQLGQAAAGRLGEMTANPQPFTQQFRPGSPGQPAPSGFQPFQPSGGMPTLGSIGQPPQGPPQAVPRGGMGQPPMVRLRAPDGSVSPQPFSMEDAQGVIARARAAGHVLQMVN